MTEKADTFAQFWAFALKVYLAPDCRESFLRMQDRDGADVPMLLYCLWHGRSGRVISEERMEEATAFSRAWRAAHVEPLRSLRRGWKGGVDGLPASFSEAARCAVAEAEQEVEKLQMRFLAELDHDDSQTDAAAAIRKNLDRYEEAAGIALNAQDRGGVISRSLSESEEPRAPEE